MNNTQEAAIQELIAARAAAVNAGGVEARIAVLADDVMNFDVIGDLQMSGKAAARRGRTIVARVLRRTAALGEPQWNDVMTDHEVHIRSRTSDSLKSIYSACVGTLAP